MSQQRREAAALAMSLSDRSNNNAAAAHAAQAVKHAISFAGDALARAKGE
jgi:hypothetical protein